MGLVYWNYINTRSQMRLAVISWVLRLFSHTSLFYLLFAVFSVPWQIPGGFSLRFPCIQLAMLSRSVCSNITPSVSSVLPQEYLVFPVPSSCVSCTLCNLFHRDSPRGTQPIHFLMSCRWVPLTSPCALSKIPMHLCLGITLFTVPFAFP